MSFKNKFRVEVFLSMFVLILGLYIPYNSYFNASGPFGFFESFFFLLLCFGFTLNTTLNFFNKKWDYRNHYIPFLLSLTGTVIAFSIFYVDQRTFEKIDWKMNYETRKQIVSEILSGKIKMNESKLLQLNTFVPVSNGGNEIFIKKCKTGITVKFWIDRGFLDHHSEFIFTNCTEDIKAINHILKKNKNSELYRQIEPNWYRLNNF